jgi:hypothetical protein
MLWLLNAQYPLDKRWMGPTVWLCGRDGGGGVVVVFLLCCSYLKLYTISLMLQLLEAVYNTAVVETSHIYGSRSKSR